MNTQEKRVGRIVIDHSNNQYNGFAQIEDSLGHIGIVRINKNRRLQNVLVKQKPESETRGMYEISRGGL
jgi:hypothetical protein